MPILRQSSNPIQYVPDFSFLGDVGNVAAKFVNKYPELKAIDQSVKDNASHKEDLQQGMLGVMQAIKEDPENREAYATKYGIDEAQVDEHLANTFSTLTPKESEKAGDYTNRVFNFTQETIGDLPGAKDGLFTQYVATMSGGEGVDMGQIRDMKSKQTNKKMLSTIDKGIEGGEIADYGSLAKLVKQNSGGDIRKTNEILGMYEGQKGAWEKSAADQKNTEQTELVDANADAGATQFYTLDPMQWATTGKQEYRRQLMEGIDVNNKMAVEKVQQKIDDIDDVMNFKQKADMFKEQARQRAQAQGTQQATKVLALVNRKVNDIESANSKINTVIKDKEKAGILTPEEKAAADLAIRRNDIAKNHFKKTGQEINENIATGTYSAKSAFAKEGIEEETAAVDKSAAIDILTGGIEGSKTQILDAKTGFLAFGLGGEDEIAAKATQELNNVIGQGVNVVYDEAADIFNVDINGESIGSFKKSDINRDGTLEKFTTLEEGTQTTSPEGAVGIKETIVTEFGQPNYDKVKQLYASKGYNLSDAQILDILRKKKG